MKLCKTCGNTGKFTPNINYKDGLEVHCTNCISIFRKEYKSKNKLISLHIANHRKSKKIPPTEEVKVLGHKDEPYYSEEYLLNPLEYKVEDLKGDELEIYQLLIAN